MVIGRPRIVGPVNAASEDFLALVVAFFSA
jgi:hypothetical protein